MAVKKPLVLTSGHVEQLQAGDSISGAVATVDIKQTEVDFGSTPIAEAIFTIEDAEVGPMSQIMASVAYEAPTGKDLDELTMDDLVVIAGNVGEGIFDLFIKAVDGSYLADKFKINYLIG